MKILKKTIKVFFSCKLSMAVPFEQIGKEEGRGIKKKEYNFLKM